MARPLLQPSIFVVLAIALGAQIAPAATPVWIDTDISFGSPIREVDDAYAIVLALRSPELRVVGCSTTYGNASLSATTRSAERLRNQFPSPTELPRIWPGATRAGDSKLTPATEALARQMERERLTYLALGPLTNLAALLQRYPELAARIDEVILVGGRSPNESLAVDPLGAFRIHDANVVKDAEAVRRILATRIPLTLVPIETARNLALTASDLHRLRESAKPAPSLANGSRIWMWFWKTIVRRDDGPIFDALATLEAARPELTRRESRNALVNASGELIVRRGGSGRPVRFVTGFAAEAKTILVRRLCLTSEDRDSEASR